MSAIALPRRIQLTSQSAPLCARIGVKLNGADLGTSCVAYDVDAGWVRVREPGVFGTLLKHGTVEPYFRAPVGGRARMGEAA